ncbi:hypothetical protein NL676_039589 [Syzygium grande]|nr:hypothetical protein NL676_039589 [Syzygium grande]
MLRCLAREIIRKGFHDPGTVVGLHLPAIAQDTNKGKKGTDYHNTEEAGFEIPSNATFLSLGRANIGGQFADTLMNMERLKVLNLTDPSINDLKRLVTLNLKFCSELSMLPVEMDGMNALKELLIDGTSIRQLPASIGKLVQLQILGATNCSSLVHVPGSICDQTLSLSVLALDDAKILELPESLGNLWQLRRLSLRDCRGLGKLPESIGKLRFSLVELDISGWVSFRPNGTRLTRVNLGLKDKNLPKLKNRTASQHERVGLASSFRITLRTALTDTRKDLEKQIKQ